MNDFEYALDRIKMGVERINLNIPKTELLNTAYHEAGHTLISILTKDAFPVHKVTIQARG